jgi:V8-like Glu-specific endopeptidase
LLALLLGTATAQAGERAIFSADSPQQLRAVGKLTVPGSDRVDGERRHRDENCSASLVGPSTILTAWHCLEYYRDLSREPVFTLPLVPGQDAIPARRLADGGSMDADWAILRLAQPIHSVKPLQVVAFSSTDNEVMIAGYARDDGLGAGGEKLTWQAGCKLSEANRRRVGTDCVTYKGASGGAVLSATGIVGVISAGDSSEQTFFSPSRGFLTLVRAHAR